MGDRVVVALEVGLGPGEVVEGVQARGELGIGEAVEQRDGLVAVLAGGGDLAGGGLAEREHGGRGGEQHAVLDAAGGLQRAAPVGEGLREVHPVQPVDGELDLQLGGRGARAVGQVLPGPGQAPMGVVVATEPVLDGGAHRGQLDAPARRARRQQLAGLQQRRAAVLELAERALGGGERDAHVDVAVAVVARQQPQRG